MPRWYLFRLVSAIETLSTNMPLVIRTISWKAGRHRFLSNNPRCPRNSERAKDGLRCQKIEKEIRPLIEKTLQRILQGGNFKAKQLKIKRANLGKVLNVSTQLGRNISTRRADVLESAV